ncbi:MAG: hypothetical protein ACOYOP_15640 [Microthrixaceae bacterium]
MLRRPDIAARKVALARVVTWADETLDPEVARAVMRAATASYPFVSGERRDPGELLVRQLWTRPTTLTVGEVEGAYLVASDRVRRGLLHLLALRCDDEGLDGLVHLLSEDGPADLLPLPTPGLLDPVLDHPEAQRLVHPLTTVVLRRGWASHACALLASLAVSGRLDDAVADDLVGRLRPLLHELVDACDRQMVDGGDADRSRADRRRLDGVLALAAALDGPAAANLLLRALSSADPRVVAAAAVRVVERGGVVPDERLELTARDPEARSLLLDGLHALAELADGSGGGDGAMPALAPDALARGPLRAEADLVAWLCGDGELGRAPDELEHLAAVRDDTAAVPAEVHVFRFRLRSPHWSSARGWMVGAAGPYTSLGSVPPGSNRFALSLYDAEDEAGIGEHLAEILRARELWFDDDVA